MFSVQNYVCLSQLPHWQTFSWKPEGIGEEIHYLTRDRIVLGYAVTKRKEDHTWIFSFEISPLYQKRGYGTLLLSELKKEGKLRFTPNETSVPFYTKNGGRFLNEDVFVMELEEQLISR